MKKIEKVSRNRFPKLNKSLCVEMSSTAATTHYFITQPFNIDILYARIQERNVFEFNFDVQVFVAQNCDEGWDDSATKSILSFMCLHIF